VSILFSSRIALLVERRMTTLGWPGAHVHWDTQENHKKRTVAAGTEWQLPRPPCHSYTQGCHAVLAYIACVAPAGNVGKGVKKAAAAVGRRLSDSAATVQNLLRKKGEGGKRKGACRTDESPRTIRGFFALLFDSVLPSFCPKYPIGSMVADVSVDQQKKTVNVVPGQVHDLLGGLHQPLGSHWKHTHGRTGWTAVARSRKGNDHKADAGIVRGHTPSRDLEVNAAASSNPRFSLILWWIVVQFHPVLFTQNQTNSIKLITVATQRTNKNILITTKYLQLRTGTRASSSSSRQHVQYTELFKTDDLFQIKVRFCKARSSCSASFGGGDAQGDFNLSEQICGRLRTPST
jgi:hypothetical protein